MNKLSSLAMIALGLGLGVTIFTPAVAQHDMKDHTLSKQSVGSPSKQMHASMAGMSKRMSAMKMTGNTDTDFAMMMAEHHLGAIEMAAIEVKFGKNKTLVSMAKKMIADQKAERAILLKHAGKKH